MNKYLLRNVLFMPNVYQSLEVVGLLNKALQKGLQMKTRKYTEIHTAGLIKCMPVQNTNIISWMYNKSCYTSMMIYMW